MLSRRKFIKSSSALTALSLVPFSVSMAGSKGEMSELNQRIFPKRLKEGDTIGLITPGGPINEVQLKETVEKLKNLGFNTYYEDSVL